MLIENNRKSFSSSHFNEFLQSEIKQKLSSSQKIARTTAIAGTKIINVFCASEVLCSPPQSTVQIKRLLLLGSITEENKI